MTSAPCFRSGLILFGASWLAYDHYRPWVNFHSEALACAGLMLLFSGSLLDTRLSKHWPACTGWILIAACMPWLWWAVGIGLFAGDALLVSIYLAALAAAVVTGYGWSAHPMPAARDEALAAFASVCVMVAIASAAIGLLQWLTLTDPLGMYVVQTDPGDRAMGNLGQPNQLGTLLLMGMAAVLMLFESMKIDRLALALGISFLTLVLVMTQSRSAMVSVAVITAFLFAKISHLSRLRREILLAWFLAFVMATVLLPLFAQMLLLHDVRDAAALSHTSDRLIIWTQVLAGIADAPWFGYGWNQTPTAHAAGALSAPGSTTYSYAHNVVLDLVAWNGVPLGLVWTALAAYWLCSRLKRAVTPVAIVAMAALLPLAVHSLLEYPFAYAYFLTFGGLLIGIVEAHHPGARALPMRRRWAWAVLVPWVLVGTYICYEYLLIEEDFRIVRFENLRIGQTPAGYEVPNVWMLSHMADMLKAARARPTPSMQSEEIERLRKVALRFPWGALHLRYASALALNGDPQGAAQEMRVIRGMFGDDYYTAAKYELLELRKRYPQSNTLELP